MRRLAALSRRIGRCLSSTFLSNGSRVCPANQRMKRFFQNVGTKGPSRYITYGRIVSFWQACKPTSARTSSASRLGEPLGQRHPDDACDRPQVQDRDVPFAPFHRPDERSVKIAFLGEVLLRPSPNQPVRARASCPSNGCVPSPGCGVSFDRKSVTRRQ